jgi:hypothetical protein
MRSVGSLASGILRWWPLNFGNEFNKSLQAVLAILQMQIFGFGRFEFIIDSQFPKTTFTDVLRGFHGERKFTMWTKNATHRITDSACLGMSKT